MKVLIVIAPEKFRDEEFTVPAAALQKAGIGYDVASTRRGTCRGMLGATVNATLSLKEVDPGTYDGILIVGGGGAQSYLWDDDILCGLVKSIHQSAGAVAAICLALSSLPVPRSSKGKKQPFSALRSRLAR